MNNSMATIQPVYDYYSAIEAQPVEWLWYPFIPYGKITLLQGDPGEGKSTFALNLAALLTRGGQIPGESATFFPQNVIYQSDEDGKEDTIKPRLIAAGADCSKVAFINDEDDPVTLDDERIQRCIKETGARLLILDPLQSFLRQEGEMQSAVKVRGLMRRLSVIAAEYNCAILLIGHLNKASGGKVLYRGLGSIDITAIARSVLMLTRDKDNSNIRYMYQVKSSLAPEGSCIAFMFEPEKGFRWLGKCRIQDEQLDVGSTKTTKREQAKEVLRILLSAGDLKSTDVFEQMQNLGISERTIRTAEKELGVFSYRLNNTWYMSLEQEGRRNGKAV